MDKFNCFVIVFYTIISLLTVSSFVLSKRMNTHKKKYGKSLYVRKREVDEKWIIKEKSIMRNLKNGNIKCHLLKNSAPTYNVKSWVHNMQLFLKKQICNDLIMLEGNDIDEEH